MNIVTAAELAAAWYSRTLTGVKEYRIYMSKCLKKLPDATFERTAFARSFTQDLISDGAGHCFHNAASLLAALLPLPFFQNGSFFYCIGDSLVTDVVEQHIVLLFRSASEKYTMLLEPSVHGGFCVDISNLWPATQSAPAPAQASDTTTIAVHFCKGGSLSVVDVRVGAAGSCEVAGRNSRYDWKSVGSWQPYNEAIAVDLCCLLRGGKLALGLDASNLSISFRQILASAIVARVLDNKKRTDSELHVAFGQVCQQESMRIAVAAMDGEASPAAGFRTTRTELGHAYENHDLGSEIAKSFAQSAASF